MKGKREGRRKWVKCVEEIKEYLEYIKGRMKGSEEGEEDIKRMSRIYERKEGG